MSPMRCERDVFLAVDQFLVDLVGHRIDIVILAEICHELHGFVVEDRTRRIRGGVDHDHLGPGIHPFEERVVELEGFGVDRVLHDFPAGDLDAGLIGDPGRGEEDRLVPGVQDRFHRLVDRILCPAGNDHLLGGAGEVVLRCDLLADG
jgi:hypothetical protein